VAERARLERDGDVGILVLDDPPLNLFGREMVQDLLTALDASDGVRALLVRAEGELFTGGADVHVFEGLSVSEAERFVADLMAVAHRIEELPVPTLASVQGLCLTAGLELSLACDMIWASEDARFGLVEAVVGLTPLMGGTQRVAERAGPARAREFVMGAGLYDAATLAGALERRQSRAAQGGPRREGAELRPAARRWTDPCPRRHEADRARLPRARGPRSRRAHARHRRSALRDRRPTRGREVVPGRRTGSGEIQRELTSLGREPLVAWSLLGRPGPA
jgi:enoyl-CoA hydratase/carnithine racemase